MHDHRIVIFEPNFRGHRMNYVAHVLRWCVSNNIAVQLATSSDTIRSSEFALRFPEGLPGERLIDLGELPSIDKRYYFRWVRDWLKSIALAGPDAQIIVLEGDKLLLSPVLRLPRHTLSRITLLVMRAPLPPVWGTLRARELLKWFLIRFARTRRTRILALSPAVAPSESYTYRDMPAVPDPVDIAADRDDVVTYRATHGLSPRHRWIGVFGHITSRKNVDLIARALAQSPSAANYGLLIAGKMSPTEVTRCQDAFTDLTQAGAILVLHNALLTDVELDAAMQSVNVVVVAHSSDGPSGILARAAANRTAILAAGPSSLQEDLARLNATGAFVPLTQAGIAAGIDDLLNLETTRPQGVVPADGSEFARAIILSSEWDT